MQITETDFKGLLILQPKIFVDGRGTFFESYNHNELVDILDTEFVQDNESFSRYGVIRGFHYQIGDMAQAKLVRVTYGKVLDVVIDLRIDEPTYGRTFAIILDDETKKQMFIPRGFAHGFAVLSQEAIFAYKCDNYYSKNHEGGIAFNDPSLNIDWLIPNDRLIVSTKDLELPRFGDHKAIGKL